MRAASVINLYLGSVIAEDPDLALDDDEGLYSVWVAVLGDVSAQVPINIRFPIVNQMPLEELVRLTMHCEYSQRKRPDLSCVRSCYGCAVPIAHTNPTTIR